MAGLVVGCDDGGDSPLTTETSEAPVVADQAEPNNDAYPLDTCVVSGEKLGSMGQVHEVQIEGQITKLCCAGCEDSLRAEPEKYLVMLMGDQTEAQSQDDGHTHGDHQH
jgi:hypothetical protein